MQSVAHGRLKTADELPDPPATPSDRDHTHHREPSPGPAAASGQDANHGHRRIARLVAGELDHKVIGPAEIEGLRNDLDGRPDEDVLPLVRPVLRSLIRQRIDLGTALDAFAGVDPIRLPPQRLIGLIEELLDDAEQALEGTRPAAPAHGTRVEDMVIALRPANAPPGQRVAGWQEPAVAAGPPSGLSAPRRRLAAASLTFAVMLLWPASPYRQEAASVINAARAAAAIQLAHSAANEVVAPSPAPVLSAAAVPEPERQPPPVQAQAPPPSPPVADPAIAAFYASRGDQLLAQKDISAARKFYEFAAQAGSAQAATALARTYDPKVLASLGIFGLKADPALANLWYRRAALLAGPSAEARLALERQLPK